MPRITIEINDSLEERVQEAISQVRDLLVDYLVDNGTESLPCLYNDLDYTGRVHEIVDSCVPIYTREIEETWFLHSRDLEDAFRDHEGDADTRQNNGTAAIYYYIESRVSKWFEENAGKIFEDSQGGAE